MGAMKNWKHAKFSGKSFMDHSVPVNSKSPVRRLGPSQTADKMPPKKSSR